MSAWPDARGILPNDKKALQHTSDVIAGMRQRILREAYQAREMHDEAMRADPRPARKQRTRSA